MGFGEYPAEYNRAVHGTYDPARYYGKGKNNKIVPISRQKKPSVIYCNFICHM